MVGPLWAVAPSWRRKHLSEEQPRLAWVGCLMSHSLIILQEATVWVLQGVWGSSWSYRVWTLAEHQFRHLVTIKQWSRIRTLFKAVETEEAASPIWLGHLTSDVMDMDIVVSGIIWVALVTLGHFGSHQSPWAPDLQKLSVTHGFWFDRK